MKNTIEHVIKLFIDDELFLHNYTKTENMLNHNYDAKLTVKIGKRIEKNLQIILQSDEGIVQFKKLVLHSNPYIRFVAARYLYPLMTQEALDIMNEYKNQLSNELSKHEIEKVIEGLNKRQPVFISQFQRLYGYNYDRYCFVN